MSLRYLRDNFSQLEVATEKVVPGFSAYDSMEKQAESVPLGSDGLIILPYLMGERTPLWDVHARGVIFGLSLKHTKAHLVRAMMEGVTFAMYDSFSIIRDHCPTINLPIVLNEGGAKNRLWRRMITDIFNVPTVFVKSRIGAPMGDAILAGVATGIFKDFGIAKRRPSISTAWIPSQQITTVIWTTTSFTAGFILTSRRILLRARLREQHQPLSR